MTEQSSRPQVKVQHRCHKYLNLLLATATGTLRVRSFHSLGATGHVASSCCSLHCHALGLVITPLASSLSSRTYRSHSTRSQCPFALSSSSYWPQLLLLSSHLSLRSRCRLASPISPLSKASSLLYVLATLFALSCRASQKSGRRPRRSANPASNIADHEHSQPLPMLFLRTVRGW